jgi:hypothetical protein
VTAGPSWRRARGSILGSWRLVGIAAAAAARIGGREMRRGPAWPRRLWTLLSSGHRAGVHSHVPLPWVVIGRPQCIDPVIGTSGGGGLARRTTMAPNRWCCSCRCGHRHYRYCDFCCEDSRRSGTVHVKHLQEKIIPKFEEVR